MGEFYECAIVVAPLVARPHESAPRLTPASALLFRPRFARGGK